jgi:O-antigen ligase
MSSTAVRNPAPRPALALHTESVRTGDGERLALGLTAVAVAMLPLLTPGGPGNLAPVDPLIALALAGCLLWAGKSGHRLRFPYVAPMALLVAGGALGALAGPVPKDGIVALSQDLWLVAWCWAVANLASSHERLKVLLATWAYSAIAWAVALFAGLIAGASALTGQTASEGSRTALTFGDPSYCASYFFISIMIIWASKYPRRRSMRVAAYALLIAALVSTGSNSGMVSVIVGVATAAVIGIYLRRGLVPAVAAFAVLLLGGFVVASSVSWTEIQRNAHRSQYAFLRDGIGRGYASAAHREALFQQGIELYRTGGPLGQGPVSTKFRLRSEMAPLAKEAHDDYLAALIERGLLGLLGFTLLVGALVLRIHNLARDRLDEGFAAVVVRPNALIGAIAGTLAAMAVYELLHVRHVWAMFAFVAALYLWGRR